MPSVSEENYTVIKVFLSRRLRRVNRPEESLFFLVCSSILTQAFAKEMRQIKANFRTRLWRDGDSSHIYDNNANPAGLNGLANGGRNRSTSRYRTNGAHTLKAVQTTRPIGSALCGEVCWLPKNQHVDASLVATFIGHQQLELTTPRNPRLERASWFLSLLFFFQEGFDSGFGNLGRLQR